MSEREEIQSLYIRLCRDSRFSISATAAAILAGNVLRISPVQVWVAFSGLHLMEEIASGRHPSCKARPPQRRVIFLEATKK